jgi:hypothetical protein
MNNKENQPSRNSINVTFLPSNVMLGINCWQLTTQDNQHVWGIDLGFIFFSIGYARSSKN